MGLEMMKKFYLLGKTTENGRKTRVGKLLTNSLFLEI